MGFFKHTVQKIEGDVISWILINTDSMANHQFLCWVRFGRFIPHMVENPTVHRKDSEIIESTQKVPTSLPRDQSWQEGTGLGVHLKWSGFYLRIRGVNMKPIPPSPNSFSYRGSYSKHMGEGSLIPFHAIWGLCWYSFWYIGCELWSWKPESTTFLVGFLARMPKQKTTTPKKRHYPP